GEESRSRSGSVQVRDPTDGRCRGCRALIVDASSHLTWHRQPTPPRTPWFRVRAVAVIRNATARPLRESPRGRTAWLNRHPRRTWARPPPGPLGRPDPAAAPATGGVGAVRGRGGVHHTEDRTCAPFVSRCDLEPRRHDESRNVFPFCRRAPQAERLLAGGQLPVGGPDLPSRQSTAEGAARARAHQATPARPLGDHA